MAVEGGVGDHAQDTAEVAEAEAVVLSPASANNSGMSELPPDARSLVDHARGETVKKLWTVTEKMNILYPENWTRRAAEEMLWFQDQLVTAFERQFQELRSQYASKQVMASAAEGGGGRLRPHPSLSPSDWTFARGLLYAVSLLTTVGEWPLT